MSQWQQHDRHGPDGPRWVLVSILVGIVAFILIAPAVMR